MSVTVNLSFEGEALGEIPSCDVAEHICKLVRDELVRVSALPDCYASVAAGEEKAAVEVRDIFSDDPLRPAYNTRRFTLSGYYYVPDTAQAQDAAPEAPPAP